MTGPTTAAGTVDVDGKGKIWATTGPGAVRFDPRNERSSQSSNLRFTKTQTVSEVPTDWLQTQMAMPGGRK